MSVSAFLLCISSLLHTVSWGCASQDASRATSLTEMLNELQTVKENHSDQTQVDKRSVDPGCDRFVYYPNILSSLGEELERVGDGYSPEECQQACRLTTSFVCTAIQIHKPAACFTTGYRLRNDFFNVHYFRTCQHGPNCFVPAEGKSAGFTNFVNIPNYLQSSTQAQALYCMAYCEQRDACVGFDLPQHRGRRRCAFMEMDMMRSVHFDLYIKRC